MSKKKPGRSGQENKPETGTRPEFLQSLARMLFLVGGTLALGTAVYSALSASDVVNDYILKNKPNLLRTEAILFSVIAAAFLYGAFKLVFRLAEKKLDYLVFILAFAAITGNFSLSFDRDIGSFGDNASYIINAKALVEKGGPYRMEHVDQPYDYKAALGLPVMLSPIVAFWGLDVVKMKALVFTMGCLSLVFFFLAFSKRMGIYAAALLTILIGTYPTIIYNTSYVMTEVPFIFAMSATLYAAMLLLEAKSTARIIGFGLATALLAILSYMTRAVGIGVIAGTIFWLFLMIPWKQVFAGEVKLFPSPEFRKFALVTLLTGLFVVGWQLRGAGSSVETDQETGVETEVLNKSQAGTFLERDITENFRRNYDLCKPLWAQQMFSEKLSRWYLSLGKAAQIKAFGPGLALFNAVMIFALIIGLLRRRLVAYWFLLIILATLTGSNSTQGVVFSRYLIVVVPFLIFLFADLLLTGPAWLEEKYELKGLKPAGAVAAILFTGLMFSHNLSGAAFNNQRQNAGDTYTIAFDNYIRAATWVKENLPGDDVIVASRKPRLFYIYSEKRGVVTVYSNAQTYSAELEADILGRMREKGAGYIVLDGFSTASRMVVLPIIQNNPELFRVIQEVGERYPAYVIEFAG